MEQISLLPEDFVPILDITIPQNAEKVRQIIARQPLSDQPFANLVINLNNSLSEEGSIYLEFNGTKVVVKVLPPTDIDNNDDLLTPNMAKVNIDIQFLETAKRTYKHERHESMLHREAKHAIENILIRALYTNMLVDVAVVVIDDNGCALPLIINGCVLALIEAGISIFNVVAASSVFIFGDTIVDNPTGELADFIDQARTSPDNKYFGTMTCTQDDKELMPQIDCSGCFTPEQFQAMHVRCKFLNHMMRKIFRKVLSDSVISKCEKGTEEEIDIEWNDELRLQMARDRQINGDVSTVIGKSEQNME